MRVDGRGRPDGKHVLEEHAVCEPAEPRNEQRPCLLDSGVGVGVGDAAHPLRGGLVGPVLPQFPVHEVAELSEEGVLTNDAGNQVHVTGTLLPSEEAPAAENPADPHRQVGGAAAFAERDETVEEDGLAASHSASFPTATEMVCTYNIVTISQDMSTVR